MYRIFSIKPPLTRRASRVGLSHKGRGKSALGVFIQQRPHKGRGNTLHFPIYSTPPFHGRGKNASVFIQQRPHKEKARRFSLRLHKTNHDQHLTKKVRLGILPQKGLKKR
jgi:hypothetical protein